MLLKCTIINFILNFIQLLSISIIFLISNHIKISMSFLVKNSSLGVTDTVDLLYFVLDFQ